MEEKKIQYSYHTFLYPFRWSNCSREVFEENIKKNGWQENDMVTTDNRLRSVVVDIDEDILQQRLDYQAYQYFNPATRNALFRGDGQIVHNYVLEKEKVHNKSNYIINAKNKTYELNINNISLKLFNTDVGILVLETEYWIEDKEISIYQARKDVLAINEYGRRLYPEYLPAKLKIGEGKKVESDFLESNICASYIAIKIGDTVIKENIQEKAEKHLKGETGESYLENPRQPFTIINQLLFGEETSNNMDIIPAIDDRMFVCCCILDEKWGKHFTDNKDRAKCNAQDGLWNFMNDWKTGLELYGLINIDAGTVSCQNRVMLNHYFEEQLYLRWVEFGTIHAVTNHSMFCITSKFVEDSVVNPFLVLYVQMCCLVLAQRASLIAFDSEITRTIATSVEQGRKRKSERLYAQKVRREKLIDLERKFTLFQGELLIAEITSQIQGIELYKKLRDMLFIDKLHDNIQVQVRNLFEIAEAEQQESDSKIEKALSVLAILAVASFCTDFYDFVNKGNGDSYVKEIWIGTIIVLLLIVVLSGLVPVIIDGIGIRCYGFVQWLRRLYQKWNKRK